MCAAYEIRLAETAEPAWGEWFAGWEIAAHPAGGTLIRGEPSVDVLLAAGVKVVRIFGPEHGFRGNASNGTAVDDEVDAKTGLPVISLYGSKRKPGREDLADVDVLIFDLQDVGVRFYTKLNTLRE